MPLTCEDYHRMAEAGILTEDDRVELLDGEIVFMSPIGNPHQSITDKLVAVFAPKLTGQAICRVQGSVRVSDFTEPQPDLVLLKMREDYYKNAFAGPDHVHLIVEVAESSLKTDLDRKAVLYAKAGIVEYWVVDVANATVHVHREPQPEGQYGSVEVRDASPSSQGLSPQSFPDCAIDLKWLFG